eukprot:3035462-Prymnesium_polylepis.2
MRRAGRRRAGTSARRGAMAGRPTRRHSSQSTAASRTPPPTRGAWRSAWLRRRASRLTSSAARRFA